MCVNTSHHSDCGCTRSKSCKCNTCAPRRGVMGRTGIGKKGDKGEKGDTVVGPAGPDGTDGLDATANWILKADPPNTVQINNADTVGILGTGGIQTILSGQNVIISPAPGFFMTFWNLEANNVSPEQILDTETVSFNGVNGITTSRSGKNIIIDGAGITPTSLTVKESDGTPTVNGVTTIQIDQSSGLNLTDNGGGQVTISKTLQNLWATFVADTGTTTANTTTDTLTVAGTGGIVTSITGDTLTIDGSGIVSGSSLTVKEADGNPSLSSIGTLTFDQAKGFTVTAGGPGEAIISLSNFGTMSSWTASDNVTTAAVTDNEIVKWVGAGGISVVLNAGSQTFTIDGTGIGYSWNVAKGGASGAQGTFAINNGKTLTFIEGANIGLNLVETAPGTGNYSLTITGTAAPGGGMNSWLIGDSSATESITDGELVKIVGGTGITTALTVGNPAVLTINSAHKWRLDTTTTNSSVDINYNKIVKFVAGTNITSITHAETTPGSGNYNVTINAATAGGTGITVEEEGAVVGTGFTILNFIGATVTATDATGGQANITISAGTAGMNTWDFKGSFGTTETVTDLDLVDFKGLNGIKTTSINPLELRTELGYDTSSNSGLISIRYIDTNAFGLAITDGFSSSATNAPANSSMVFGGTGHTHSSTALSSGIFCGNFNNLGFATGSAVYRSVTLGGTALNLATATGGASNGFLLAGNTNTLTAGATSTNSGIAGGFTNTILANVSNTVISGGQFIVAGQGDTTYVGALVIKGVAPDSSVSKILVWDTTTPTPGTVGLVKYRDITTLAGGLGALTDARQGLIKNTDGLPTPTYWAELGNPTFDDTPVDALEGRITTDRWINLKGNNIAFVAKGTSFLAPAIDSSAENNFIAGGVSHNIDGISARENLVYGRQSHVTGSERCLVGGTESQSSSSAENSIAIGYQCSVENLNTTAIGYKSFAYAPQAFVIGESCEGGQGNSFAGGKLAKAERLAQMSRSSGLDGVAAQGYSQRSQVELYVRTTTAAPTNLEISGLDNIKIPQDAIVQFEILVTAAASTGTPRVIQRGASWKIEGTIVNTSGTTSFISVTHLPLYHVRITSGTVLSATTTDVGKPRDFSDATSGAWRLNVLADNAADELLLQAVGDVTNDIAWQATVILNEIKLPS